MLWAYFKLNRKYYAINFLSYFISPLTEYVLGLADWLAKRKLSYNNLSEISNLFEEIGYWCTYSSMELAKERGAYQAFLGSEWSQGKLIGAKPVAWFLNNAVQPQRWQQLAADIQRFGIRNSHITAIAPNTSSEIQSQEQTSQTSHPSGGSGLPSKVSTMEDLKNPCKIIQ